MAQKPTLPLENTTNFLDEKFNNEISELTLLKGGEWSQAYSFIHKDKKYVLRWCNSSETFEKDAFVSAFSSSLMPIPKIIDAGIKFDKHYAISEFVEGSFIEKVSPRELEATLPAIFNLFDALRTADLSSSHGYGAWDKNGNGSHKSWKEFLLSVNKDPKEAITHGWYENLKSSELGTELFDQLYARLESQADKCPEVRELIHSDLLNFNLLILDNKISGVIDWQCSLYGDSMYDIAWFLYYAPWYPQFKEINLCEKILAHYKSVSQNNENIEERLLCYYLHIGLGSIAYNSFKKDWKAAHEAAEYTLKLL